MAGLGNEPKRNCSECLTLSAAMLAMLPWIKARLGR